MQNGANHSERTFVAVKPDGVQRCLVSQVLKRFEQRGYKLVAMKMVQATQEKVEEVRSHKKPSLRALPCILYILTVDVIEWPRLHCE